MSTAQDSAQPAGPEQSSNPWNGGFIQWFWNIIDWLRSMTPSWATTYDSGPVDIELNSGITGSFWYQRIGRIVIVSGNIAGAFPTGNTELGNIPNTLRPLRNNARGAMYCTGPTSGTAWVTTNGNIGITHDNASTRTDASFTVMYVVG